jgi:hypothetical protein
MKQQPETEPKCVLPSIIEVEVWSDWNVARSSIVDWRLVDSRWIGQTSNADPRTKDQGANGATKNATTVCKWDKQTWKNIHVNDYKTLKKGSLKLL